MFAPLKAVLAGTILAIFSASSVIAQSPGNPWPEVYPPNIRYEGITSAERTAAIAVLKRIEALFRQIPELTNPAEFVVKKDYYGGHRPPEIRNGLAGYSLRIWFFSRYGPERKVAGEGGTCIQVVVNADPTDPKPYSIESERGEPLPGTTVVNGRLIEGQGGGIAAVYTQGGVFPWTPFTREQYLRAQILEFEGKDGEWKTPYEEWVAGAAQRKKDRDDLALQLRGIKSTEEIKAIIAQQEKQDLEMTEQLKARETEDRLRNQQAMRISAAPGDELRARLAAMSAEERAKPAMVYLNWEMPPDGTPNTFRVLTPTLDYWKVRRSPVEVRTLVVNMGGVSGTCASAPVRDAIWQVYKKLDWAALKQMVEGMP